MQRSRSVHQSQDCWPVSLLIHCASSMSLPKWWQRAGQEPPKFSNTLPQAPTIARALRPYNSLWGNAHRYVVGKQGIRHHDTAKCCQTWTARPVHVYGPSPSVDDWRCDQIGDLVRTQEPDLETRARKLLGAFGRSSGRDNTDGINKGPAEKSTGAHGSCRISGGAAAVPNSPQAGQNPERGFPVSTCLLGPSHILGLVKR